MGRGDLERRQWRAPTGPLGAAGIKAKIAHEDAAARFVPLIRAGPDAFPNTLRLKEIWPPNLGRPPPCFVSALVLLFTRTKSATALKSLGHRDLAAAGAGRFACPPLPCRAFGSTEGCPVLRLLFPTLSLADPRAGALAGLDGQRPQPRPVRRAGQEGRCVPLAPGPRPRSRGTHEPGHHGGAVGHTALQVLHALIFDFLNNSTGRLGSVLRGDRAEGWRVRAHRRHGSATAPRAGHPPTGCAAVPKAGRTGGSSLEQQSNGGMALLPEGQWRGYRPPPEAPEPEWGRTPIMPSALAQAALEDDPAAKAQVLTVSAMTPLERALASSFQSQHPLRATREFYWSAPRCGETFPRLKTYLHHRLGPVERRKEGAQ